MTRRDPVTQEVREAVFARDGALMGWSIPDRVICVAPYLDADCGPCGGRTTLDHVQSGYGRMGRRGPSDAAHLVCVCSRHHLETGWATSHKAELRIYLAGKVEPA